jgi:hypothetical protein
METRPTHLRRATTVSVVLHVSLALVAWWFARPSAVVRVWWFDGLARAMTGPRYEPAELIPIELPERTVVAASQLGTRTDEPDRVPDHVEVSRPIERPERPRVRSESDGGRPAVTPEPTSSDPHPVHGLADAGEQRAVDPDLLRGSAALYAASVPRGEVEGPRRPPGTDAPSDDYDFVREGGEWIYRDPGDKFVATLQPDGGVEFRNKLVDVSVEAEPGLGGNGERFVTVKVEYDPIGVARLSVGRDPSPRVKAKLLAATFEMRMEVATKYHKQRLLDQLGEIQDELDGIWDRSGLSAAERRRLLFELWDDCDEPEGEIPGFESADASALDESRRAYAKAARAKIIRFIRSVAPEGGVDAYTQEELAALNSRRVSTQRFAPYDG